PENQNTPVAQKCIAFRCQAPASTSALCPAQPVCYPAWDTVVYVVRLYPQLAAARRLTSLMRSLDCDTVLEMVARTVFSSAAALSHFACASLYAAADSPSHVAAMGAMTPLRSSSRPLMRDEVELMSAAALEIAPNWYLISLMMVIPSRCCLGG